MALPCSTPTLDANPRRLPPREIDLRAAKQSESAGKQKNDAGTAFEDPGRHPISVVFGDDCCVLDPNSSHVNHYLKIGEQNPAWSARIAELASTPPQKLANKLTTYTLIAMAIFSHVGGAAAAVDDDAANVTIQEGLNVTVPFEMSHADTKQVSLLSGNATLATCYTMGMTSCDALTGATLTVKDWSPLRGLVFFPKANIGIYIVIPLDANGHFGARLRISVEPLRTTTPPVHPSDRPPSTTAWSPLGGA
ncbi:uncharacterized protein LOC144949951 [Lampetra fluviatilis]